MKRYADLTREERINKILAQRRKDLCLVLETLTEEQNISAILRTAESFGIGLICIIYEENIPKLSRNISSGAAKWLEIKYFKNTSECIKFLKKQGFKVIGALVDPKAKILWEENFSGKVAILVGNEAKGMSEKAQKLVDENIYLPMFGLTESLNVSVSAALFLYEIVRQKEAVE